MTISLPGRLVLLDYGEVISRSPSEADRAALVAAAGIPAERFWRAYQADRDRLDEGLLSTYDYWRAVGAACGRELDESTVSSLWALDVRGWLSVDPGVVEILAELHAGGTRTALLSNAGADFGGLLRFAPWARHLERSFVSGELRMLKPDPGIFRHVADELGVPAGDVVFVDNREANVRGAESIGMTGHVHTSAAGLSAFLADLAGSTTAPATTGDHR